MQTEEDPDPGLGVWTTGSGSPDPAGRTSSCTKPANALTLSECGLESGCPAPSWAPRFCPRLASCAQLGQSQALRSCPPHPPAARSAPLLRDDDTQADGPRSNAWRLSDVSSSVPFRTSAIPSSRAVKTDLGSEKHPASTSAWCSARAFPVGRWSQDQRLPPPANRTHQPPQGSLSGS